MFDCNLIKSKYQKLQEVELPTLPPGTEYEMPPVPFLPQVPQAPQHSPFPQAPIAPTTPQGPMVMPQVPIIPQMPTRPQAPTLPQVPRTTPVPSGPAFNGPFLSSPPITIPPNPLSPSTVPAPIDYESLQYLNGYLRTQIGRYVEVEFLIGSSNRVIWVGILVGVGINYILLQDATTHDITACDFYTIKFFKSYSIDFIG